MRGRSVLVVVSLLTLGFIVGRLSTTASWAASGTLDSSAPPGSTFSYTLEDIYNRLNDGTTGAQSAFTEPASGPTAGTGHTLDEIYELIGERAPVPKTGQTTSYATGDDGDLERGVAWPSPRFTDNGDGTVTDNLTGLIWLKNADCTSFFSSDTTGQNSRTWSNALTAANALANGHCELTDGSSVGDWRLPNVRELQSLIDYGRYDPALPSVHPFTGISSSRCWSSMTYVGTTSVAWYVGRSGGDVGYELKSNPRCVWPVRGGQ